MEQIIIILLSWLLGVATVGFWAALGVRRDEVLKNPTRPGRIGTVAAWAFGTMALAATLILFYIVWPWG